MATKDTDQECLGHMRYFRRRVRNAIVDTIGVVCVSIFGVASAFVYYGHYPVLVASAVIFFGAITIAMIIFSVRAFKEYMWERDHASKG